VLGRSDWPADPRYAQNRGRVAHRDALVAEIDAILQSRPAEQWVPEIEAAGIPVGPVNTLKEAFADPQVAARGLLVEVDHPVAGPIPTLAQPMKFSKTPPEYRSAPPLVGQHSREVLRAAGYTEAEIEALEAAGVAAQHP